MVSLSHAKRFNTRLQPAIEQIVEGGDDDSKLAIQTAIDDFGIAVLKPNTTYTSSGGIELDDGEAIIGHGYSSVIKLKDSGNSTLITNADTTNGNSNITLENFRIDGNRANNSTDTPVFNIIRCDEFLLKNLWCHDANGQGLSLTECFNGDVIVCHSYNNDKDGLVITSGTTASGFNAYNITVLGGTYRDNTFYGIGVIKPDTTYLRPERIQVIGAKIINNSDQGLRDKGGRYNTYIGNIIYSNARNGMEFGTPADFNVDDIIAKGNVVFDNGTVGTERDGIYLSGNNCTLSGNNCFDTQATKTQRYGINLNLGTASNVVTNNNCKNNRTNDINMAATDSTDIVRDNIHGDSLDIASASTISFNKPGDYFNITGTTGIDTITASYKGRIVTVTFAASLTVTDGSNLKLNGNFSATADDTMGLLCDATNWHEMSRSAN